MAMVLVFKCWTTLCIYTGIHRIASEGSGDKPACAGLWRADPGAATFHCTCSADRKGDSSSSWQHTYVQGCRKNVRTFCFVGSVQKRVSVQ